MGTLIMIAQLILGLSILVFIHELGHYLAARAFKIRVEKFYLFFDAWNFKLFKYKKGDTEYGIGWLPFGGYVKIAGMIDESMDKEATTTLGISFEACLATTDRYGCRSHHEPDPGYGNFYCGDFALRKRISPHIPNQ